MNTLLRRGRVLLLLTVALALAVPGVVTAQSRAPSSLADERPTVKSLKGGEAVPGQIIVKFKEGVSPSAQADVRRQVNLQKKKALDLIDAEVDKVQGRSVEAALRDLNGRPDVEYAEQDYIVHPTGYADEPLFQQVWGLHNTGQTIEGIPGTADVDVNALEASAVTQGNPNLVVAVIDDGADFSHPDLAGRAWKNPGESGGGKENNGIDDDGNGKVDDVNGWDFVSGDNTVHDADDFHGTHVAGTIAASVNGQGVVGVAPNVEIMALKFLGPFGGSTSDAILAIEYAQSKGAKISNNSWGGGPFSQALKDAIEASDMLFVAAAGNFGDDNDMNPFYPASYDSPNILSVAAINNQGNLASFSNFGATSVDISAPGVDVLSSFPGVQEESAVTLSSVGASGKALASGFGADEIGDPADRTSFMSKAFQAVNRGSQQVVLVDDDQSHAGFPDVGPTLSAAIQSATGSAPQVINVADGDGPSLAQLQGKVVVWGTGQGFTSGPGLTTLTSADQVTLSNFLNGGGKLVLTGMDALYQIENSSFVTSTLGLDAHSDVPGHKAFNGSLGTAFAGESYDLNSPSAFDPFHDVLVPMGAVAVTQGVYPSTPGSWEYLSGTSMASPHATGAAALAASKFPGLLNEPVLLKQVLMDSGKPAPATAGKTVTGDMINAKAAVTNAAPKISQVSPAPGSDTKDRTPKIGATIKDSQTNLAKSNIVLKVDGATKNFSYNRTTDRLSYTPQNNMAFGKHTIKVTAKDPQGAVGSKTWSFTVVH